jgi:hypothetical protein
VDDADSSDSSRPHEQDPDWESIQRGLVNRARRHELPLAEADAQMRRALGFPQHEEVDSVATLKLVATSARAMVFLTVPWSCPERVARSRFRAASEAIAVGYSQLQVRFFYLDEDTDWCQSWLGKLGIAQFSGTFPAGAGSILWLEFGSPVSHEMGGQTLDANEIVERTVRLWSKQG